MINTPEPVAIVGIGCRFPGGANTPAKLWELLEQRRDILKPIPSDRLNAKGFFDADGERQGCMNVQHAYTLDEDIRQFDASFFKTNALEAEAMDPQQRILLEVVYEALESAGCAMERMQGSDTSVYVGSMTGDYHEMLLRDPEDMPKYMATGTARSILSNRISYFYDWKGPSMTIDTACSSSLVALHEAVQSLRQGVSQVACAAGANLILGPEMMISESKLHMLSPTGRSRMWDAAADGYARGEGFSAVILKTLSRAIADGDFIHCIVRETGVNSDGRTNGITLPSSVSQTALIRQTYARAGIDLEKEPCQYFEAHGTGTPAGDPIEARAICEAFFPPSQGQVASTQPMFVGSVKTGIGHLEGCAGLAGLVKASEAVRRGVIPPNMLFETLNPDVLPWVNRLQVPTVALPWPTVADGSPRRASVNSFGFGGTNAHAIIESFENKHLGLSQTCEKVIPIPLVFSANSEISLRSQIESYYHLLESPDRASPVDISLTLQSKRSQHAVRVAFSGHDRASLLQSIQGSLTKEDSMGVRIDQKVDRPRILGIFTGQGAQWPTMGRELLRTSSVAQDIVQRLQGSLEKLPDPPSWTLADQIQADHASSRLAEASVAQPLCTAVQIILVDLLKIAGVTFNVVIGHSSGEIGAAYAAGMITAEDAIRIAYYRGVHAKLARGADGEKGAMMAAGMSYEDACDFCEQYFPGRLDVAASNAPGSVTLSGNEDAVYEAKALLDDQGKFARKLLVDTAYHSPHMEQCSIPYSTSLAACGIRPQPARDDCTWVSSVHGYRMQGEEHVESLTGEYWNDNMVNPVLFSIAVEVAVTGELPCDIALELGPHPALKSPFNQTFKQATTGSIAYSGTLSRDRHDVSALSDTLGFLWTRLGSSSVDFERFAAAFSIAPQWIPGLPAYSWDHRQSYWRESNKSANYRRRAQPRHPLLGSRSTEDIDQNLRWMQTLRLGELPWLNGHKVEGQVIYPAAAYLVMAIESCNDVAKDRGIQLLELYDVDIANAISLSEDAPGVDVLFSLSPRDAGSQSDMITAEWACYSRMGEGKGSWRLNARGHVRMVFGDVNSEILPPRAALEGAFVDVDVDRFYGALTEIGLNYTGAFRSLNSICRRSGVSSATLHQIPSPPLAGSIHPAILDAAFQSIFAAFCWPGDGSLRAPFVPTKLTSLRIVNGALVQAADQVQVVASIAEASGQAISADLDLYALREGNKALVQIQGLRCSCLTPPGPNDYKELYSQNVWELDIGSGISSLAAVENDAPEDLQLINLCERLSYYYLRLLNAEVDRSEVPGMEWNFQCIFEWIDYLFPWIESGTHPTIRKEWATDDPSWLLDQVTRFPDSVDLQLITAVGTHLPQVVRRETTMLEHMVRDDVLNRFYKFGLGFQRANGFMGQVLKQIAHRYPRSKILEIGAGTGGATKGILESLGETFESYTYTDISTGFFEAAATRFEPWAHKIKFRPLNVELDLSEQAYGDQTFDVIVASNVLHATKNLSATMQNVRRLLKPGGFLVLLEVTSEIVRVKLMMSGLPGWWLGGDDGRRMGPTITRDQWDSLLKETGFSGVDNVTHDFIDTSKHMTSVMVSQAVDENVMLLRQPLHQNSQWSLPSTTIIGGCTSNIAVQAQHMLTPLLSHQAQIYQIDSLADLLGHPAALQAPVLVILEDLDDSILRDFSQHKLKALQLSLPQCRRLLWVSRQCQSGDPYGNMSIGLCRALAAEHPHIALQHLDMESKIDEFTPTVIAETLVRLAFGSAIKPESDLLWTSEPELLLKNGQTFIPRILPDQRLNDRLNAQKMVIKTSSSIKDGVEILPRANGYILSEPIATVTDMHLSQLKVKVLYSLLSAIQVGPHTTAFVSYGSLVDNPHVNVIAFAETNSSTVITSPTCVFPVLSAVSGQALLQITAFGALAEQLLSRVSPGNAVVLHQADDKLGAVIQQRAGELGVLVSNVSIHPYASQKSQQKSVPSSTKLVLDFASTTSVPWEQIVPAGCEVLTLNDLFTDGSQGSTPVASSIFEKAFGWARQQIATSQVVEIIPIANLAGRARADIPYSSVVDFTDSGVVQSIARSLDPARLFHSDKTYLLAGCTGGLGQALCRWMVSQGARFLALTTRNPARVSSTWLEELRQNGAQVSVFACDVANKGSLSAACELIESSMPPIAGVANAAMVLADRSFAELKVKDFHDVWGPKVEGTKNLDEIFNDRPLDFFILFSSLASIVGNRGQSNYVAANMFMSTISEQRRQRGLAASVFHIGMVLGVGYVSSTGIYESTLRQYNYMPIAEPEFLDMFSEAILVGRPQSDHSPELITGLSRHSLSEDTQKPFWHENHRFSHHSVTEIHQTEAATTAKASLTQSIQQAQNLDDVDAAIQDAFCTKLERMLQAAKDSIERHQPLINLGVDSLIAVEIRSWFFKELDVDIPVLKVLGGASVAELCHESATKVWTDAAPVVQTEAPPAQQVVQNKPAIKESPCVSAVPTPSITENSSSATSIFDSSSVPSSLSQSPDLSQASSEKGEADSDAGNSFSRQEELPIERSSPMSFAQERLWFLRGYLRDPTTYNVTISYKVAGPLDRKTLQNAFCSVIQRHEALRTCFYNDPKSHNPTQAVLTESNFQVELKVGASVEASFDQIRHHCYDLENGEILRTIMISPSPSQHFLVIGFHHIAFDGFSAQTLIRDLAIAYAGRPLPPAPPQYIDFAIKQRSEKLERVQCDLEYWKQEFPDLPPTLPLLDFAETKSRAPLTEYKLRSMTQMLPSDLTEGIRSAARGLGCTPFHFHLSILQIVLHRLLSVTDLCIGMTDANKNDPQFLETIGFFVNLLPIRFRLETTPTFADVVGQTKKKTDQALAHSRVSVDKLLDELHVPRSTLHQPLFQVAINYKMGSTQIVPLGQCQAHALDFEDARNAYDLHFEIETLSDGSTHLTVQSQRYLYTEHEISVVVETYLHLLSVLCQDPSRDIKTVDLAPPEKSKQALHLGQVSGSPSPRFLTLSRWAAHWASIQPTATAILDDQGARLSYDQVVAAADDLAHQLVEAGIQPGDRVGVYCEPSSNILVYIIGIHKTGCVYVPLDVQNPVGRLNLMVQDCQMALILCDETTAPRAREFETNAIITQFTPRASETRSVQYPDASKGSSVACILYTSGTTGVPKGVVIKHSNLAYSVAGLRERYALGQETVLQQTSWGFDVSLGQIYQGVFGGGTVVVASSPTRKDPAQLARLMHQEKITFTIMTTTQALSLIRYGSDDLRQCSLWKFALKAGEPVTSHLVDEFRALHLTNLQVSNAYGPSEATVLACHGSNELSPSAPRDTRHPPIGRALPNYSAYILDDCQQVVPVGFAGELYLGGAGVAQGYLNQDDLTASKFLPNPFAEAAWIENGWNRMYRTGDKAKFLPDGRIVFLGRIAGDNQRKLRGFRIELDDIASTIIRTSVGRVSNAAATIRGDLEAGDSSNQVLVAFVVLSAKEVLSSDSSSFIEGLRTSLPLPQYMCPSRIIVVDSLPVNSAGKLDQPAVDALPLPTLQSVHDAGHLTDTQLQLKELWLEALPILGDATISTDSDFFSVGGNSVLLVKLQSLVFRQFGITVPVADLFQQSTLAAMASKLETADPLRSVTHIDWDEETLPVLPSTMPVTDETDNAQQVTTNLEVLLTGATGFLGSAILKQLVDDPNVVRIHCIAIRTSPDGTLRSPVVSSPKIIQYPGDLSSPLLGLSSEQYMDLSQRVHRIIHNGAAVSFLRTYISLRAPNLDSTKALAAMAAPRHIPFHYISSGGVARLFEMDTLAPVSLAEYHPSSGGQNGYSSSKWASEVYLERCAEAHQLPVWIHRPSNITGDGTPQTDLLQRIIDASLKIQSVPVLTSWRGNFDWVPVEEVAGGVVAALHSAPLTGLKFVHHCAEHKVPVAELKAHLETKHGEKLDALPIDEWVNKAVKAGQLDAATEALARGVQDQSDAVFPSLLKSE
ncbi:PKS-NRPS protein [Penicillium vulpinum]|uniref:Carrier domain-containing protein n=1 Tax=Penicillium vulpinum TaxID=29845 RepID=A0A1V6RUG9_9EURO|nr:PKS-NRPS protein [Penicillium vulpinum]KAJ5971601.1 PKS-NRPS protein [Penicillium vulpinum]OQE05417.1 hypothetical protein PENVUL_c024G09957 [Penicillium vulpinum]